MTSVLDPARRGDPTDRPEPATAPASAAPSPPRGRGVRVWREAVLVLAFYGAYSWVRGRFGSAAGGPAEALANAERVLRWEDDLHLPSELALQRWFLAWPAVVRALNVFYGLFHFLLPVATLLLLARRAPDRYRWWRNALAAATGLALVGFALFPLLPPRLLCDCPGGAGPGVDGGFVDTLARYGGLWTFGSHGMSAVSNQYAAMPSLHFAWALWCGLALASLTRRRGLRVAALAYPATTLLAVVVTANHFWLDAVGGAAIVAAGSALAWAVERAGVPWPVTAWSRRPAAAAGAVPRPSRTPPRPSLACEDRSR